MDMQIKESFLEKWEKYFPNEELPVACWYSDELPEGVDFPDKPKENKHGYTCIFSQIAPVHRGKSRAFNQENLGCFGADGTLGFLPVDINDEYVDFLTNVERFKRDRELVECMAKDNPAITAPGKYLILKRWDQLTEKDEPQIVFFFGKADAVSGLHTLANYDYKTQHGVLAPFGSGCDSLIGFAMKQVLSNGDQCILGLFDPPARGCIKKDLMTFSAPYTRFLKMLSNMDNCFLNTYIWEKIQKRMKPSE